MSRRARVGILGGGGWGTALAKHLAERGHRVTLWCHEEETAREINDQHTNTRYLIGVQVPEEVRAVTDLKEAVTRREYLLVAIPSSFLLATLKEILPLPEIMEGRVHIGVVSKGLIEARDGIRLITEAMEDYLPGVYKGRLTYISGPSHAEEVARGKVTGLISASASGRHAVRFRNLLSGGPLIVFSSLDVRGVQVSAALKNVIAIAFGMLDALGEFSDQFGDNTESLLLAAGLNEIQLLGRAMGATHPETFTSIAGVGDLDVTCRSKYGRNRRFGREIVLDRLLARFSSFEELVRGLPSLGYHPEGVFAARFAHALAVQHGLDLPVSGGVYRVLNRESEPLEEVAAILQRINRDAAADPPLG